MPRKLFETQGVDPVLPPIPEDVEETMGKFLSEAGEEATGLFEDLKEGEAFSAERLDRIDTLLQTLSETGRKYEEGGTIIDYFWDKVDAARESSGYEPSAEFLEKLKQGYESALIENQTLEMAGENTGEVEKKVADLEFEMRLVGITVAEQAAVLEEAKELSGYKQWEQQQEGKEQERRRVIAGSAHPRSRRSAEVQLSKEERAGEALMELQTNWLSLYETLAKRGRPAGVLPEELLKMEQRALKLGVTKDELERRREEMMARSGYWEMIVQKSREALLRSKEQEELASKDKESQARYDAALEDAKKKMPRGHFLTRAGEREIMLTEGDVLLKERARREAESAILQPPPEVVSLPQDKRMDMNPEDRPEREEVTETPEERERREEKERVMTALHAYYQEREQNMPLQHELAQLIERGKQLTVAALPYFEEGARAGAWVEGYHDLKPAFNYHSISLVGIDANNREDVYIWGNRFAGVLDEKFFRKFSRDTKFSDTKKEMGAVFPKLEELQRAVESQRETVFREVVVALGYGALLAEGEFMHPTIRGGLYNINGTTWFKFPQEKEDITVGQRRWSADGIGESWLLPEIIKEAKERLGITDEEIAKISKIEWAQEDKDKLQRLERAVAFYREGLPRVRPKETANFNRYTDQEYAMLLGIETAAFARIAYDEQGLPPQHQEKVVQQIKSTGRVDFE